MQGLRKAGETPCYRVINNRAGSLLGMIYYKKDWKQFVFEPEEFCVFSHDCLADIIDFLNNRAGRE
jgi:hypothetical protein